MEKKNRDQIIDIYKTFNCAKKSMCDRLHVVFVFLSRDLMRTTVHLVDVRLAEGFQAFTWSSAERVVEHFKRASTSNQQTELCKTQALGCVPWQAVISAVVRY